MNKETQKMALRNFEVCGSMFAYGEAHTAPFESRVIPSEASGNALSTEEPLESRATSSISSNSPHECPATVWTVEDVLRSSRKLESWDKEPSEDIATN